LNLSLFKNDWVKGALLALIYFVASILGRMLALPGHTETVFWPPAGIALAVLLLYGYRFWPGVFIGALCANAVVGLPWLAVLGMSVGSTLGALLGTYLLRKSNQFNLNLSKPLDIFYLLWRGAIISTFVSAFIGAFSLYGQGLIEQDQFNKTLLFWWMGDGLGVMLFTPMLIAELRHLPMIWTPTLRKQAMGLLALLLTCCLLIFTNLSIELLGHQVRVFILMPLVVWAALNFNSRMVSLIIFGVTLTASLGTGLGQGFFGESTPANRLDLWGLLLSLSMIGYALSAVNYQRNQLVSKLKRSQRNLQRAQHIAKVGSWELDIEHEKLTWSDETYQIFGLPQGAPISPAQFFSFVHPDDLAAESVAWKAALAGAPYNIEHRILINGKIKWVHEHAELDFNPDGKATFALGSVSDITESKLAEATLRQSQRSQQLMIDTALDGVIQLNSLGKITLWNQEVSNILGWSRNSVFQRKLLDMIVPDYDRTGRWQEIIHLLSAEHTDISHARCEVEAKHHDGHLLQLELSISRVTINDSLEFNIFLRDITQRKREEEQLLLAAKVFESSNESILITDVNNNIVAANDAFLRMTGYAIEEVRGHNPRFLASGCHDPAFYREMWHSINTTGCWQGEVIDHTKQGHRFFQHLAINSIRNNDGQLTHYIAISSDITERKEYDKNIHFLAYYDVLTGLPNRSLLRDRLGQLIATAHRDNMTFALLFLDLDRFKYINDSMGHSVGDKLLQSVAQRLQACVREGDTVARIGGDEFIILLREVDATGVSLVSDKILKSLATPFNLNGQIISTYASVGIALYPEHATDIDVLMKNADAAMYHAKENGRNNYKFFTPEMNFRANKLFSMEKDLRMALDQEQFTLVYQPQVDLASGLICGAEALIRWKHPENGFVSPADFIPVAEETGQIVAIGEWVLRTACWRFSQWHKKGMAQFPIAVNLSIRQLRQPNLADVIEGILKETGLNPQLLELEITEGIMMGDTKSAMTFLTRMHDLGIQMSIDDFGTGFSSLSYLKNLPVNKLKVDQSFVRDIETDESDAAIVRSIISLGHRLDLKVIAEGVENLEQLDFLRIRGCDEVQGYYISRPLGAEDFLKFVNTHPKLD
jgi:diguanylate cyclase (GGDEF)-like protein/PAS domain S-box-containing protein